MAEFDKNTIETKHIFLNPEKRQRIDQIAAWSNFYSGMLFDNQPLVQH